MQRFLIFLIVGALVLPACSTNKYKKGTATRVNLGSGEVEYWKDGQRVADEDEQPDEVSGDHILVPQPVATGGGENVFYLEHEDDG